MLTLEEIQEWVDSEKERFREHTDEATELYAHVSAMDRRRMVLEQVRDADLPGEDMQIVRQAVADEFANDQILYLLRPELTYKERQAYYKKILSQMTKKGETNGSKGR